MTSTVKMATVQQIVKKVHKLGDSHAVVIHPSLVRSLQLDSMTFVTQEATPEGDGIVMRVRRLTA